MFAEYIKAALERAEYEIMEDNEPEPYYAHVQELPGVWATGKTFEDCRNELISVIEGWIALRLRLGDPIPTIGSHTIETEAKEGPVNSRDHLEYMSAPKPLKEIELLEGEEVEKKSAVDKFYGMMKIPRKLADEIIDMEMWD